MNNQANQKPGSQESPEAKTKMNSGSSSGSGSDSGPDPDQGSDAQSRSRLHPVIRSSLLLGAIALLGTALLAGVNDLTKERIAQQDRQRVLRQLNEIVAVDSYNNNLLSDVIEIREPGLFRSELPVTIYRARMDESPVAVMMITTAPDGYNGNIRLLIGINIESTVLGVRVTAHKETPGLGDPIELERSDWVLGFNGTSLRQPDAEGWAVKRDGGDFDQFTGATISPRAVVKAVHTALLYFDAHKQAVFDQPSMPTEVPADNSASNAADDAANNAKTGLTTSTVKTHE